MPSPADLPLDNGSLLFLGQEQFIPEPFVPEHRAHV
jgi:hypothetical protein